jgi:sugar O-acyltransferase (sialic acid O-acetyltransferase NeuD family)
VRERPPLVIVGAGRHGRELEGYLHDMAAASGGALAQAPRFLGFIDEVKPAGAFGTSTVLGDFERASALAQEYGVVYFVAAAGDNTLRRRLATLSEACGLRPWTLRHPDALVGLDCSLGLGSQLAPRTILTRAVTVGAHCIINVGVTVSHDCHIGEFVNLNPGVTVSGDVELGKSCFVGAGAIIIDKVTIGEDTVIGAGAVVVDDLPAGVLALGVPARIVRELHTRPKLI